MSIVYSDFFCVRSAKKLILLLLAPFNWAEGFFDIGVIEEIKSNTHYDTCDTNRNCYINPTANKNRKDESDYHECNKHRVFTEVLKSIFIDCWILFLFKTITPFK